MQFPSRRELRLARVSVGDEEEGEWLGEAGEEGARRGGCEAGGAQERRESLAGVIHEAIVASTM